MKFEKRLTEQSDDQDNFYTIIEMAKDLIKDNDWWMAEEDDPETSDPKESVGQKIATDNRLKTTV